MPNNDPNILHFLNAIALPVGCIHVFYAYLEVKSIYTIFHRPSSSGFATFQWAMRIQRYNVHPQTSLPMQTLAAADEP
jgi:hypothetical protein